MCFVKHPPKLSVLSFQYAMRWAYLVQYKKNKVNMHCFWLSLSYKFVCNSTACGFIDLSHILWFVFVGYFLVEWRLLCFFLSKLIYPIIVIIFLYCPQTIFLHFILACINHMSLLLCPSTVFSNDWVNPWVLTPYLRIDLGVHICDICNSVDSSWDVQHQLGGRPPFSLTLPNLWGSTNGKYPPGISPSITPGMCLLQSSRVITFTLNFSEG